MVSQQIKSSPPEFPAVVDEEPYRRTSGGNEPVADGNHVLCSELLDDGYGKGLACIDIDDRQCVTNGMDAPTP